MFKSFKGTTSEYVSLHEWVRTKLGTPSCCEGCGTKEKRTYHWANVSGEYKKDLTDCKRLCVPCHVVLDHGFKCKRGHDRAKENYYMKPSGGRQCMLCKIASQSEWNKKNKERVSLYNRERYKKLKKNKE